MPAPDPICIITATGMQCMESPRKAHFPYGKDCVDASGPDPQADISAFATALQPLVGTFFTAPSKGLRQGSAPASGLVSPLPALPQRPGPAVRLSLSDRAEVVARVVYLMWTAENFDPDLPFVITRMRGKGVEPCLKKRHKKPTAKKPSKATAKR